MAYYFVSDTHLGIYSETGAIDNEARFVAWLRSVAADAEEIFLVGDIFDFWFEYKRVVPKGFSSVFAAIKEITGKGVRVHFFPGNHDMWTGDYFTRECGMTVHTGGVLTELSGKNVFIDHGDAVDIGEWRVLLIQKIFRSKWVRKLFSAVVHPGAAMKFGQWWSRKSRMKRTEKHIFRKEDEHIVKFCRKYLETHDVDYFVFGHLHSPEEYKLNEESALFVLGGWIHENEPVYGVLNSEGFSLRKFRYNGDKR